MMMLMMMMMITRTKVTLAIGGNAANCRSEPKGHMTSATPLFRKIICQFYWNCTDKAVYQILDI